MNRTRIVPHQNTVFRQITNRLPWGVLNALVQECHADKGVRRLSTCDLLLTLLYAQLSGARSLRAIEALVQSHDAQRYHSRLPRVRRSTMADAMATRPVAVFSGVLAALIPQVTGKLRRELGQCVRLIDSTTINLNALSADWSRFSAKTCGVKAHVVYDPDADTPLYLGITPSKINDIIAAKAMPIEPGATYVFDLGYYDYAWWAALDDAQCRIVTRLKKNTPLHDAIDQPLPKGAGHILSDRMGFLPARQTNNRRNPMAQAMVREIQVRIDTGKVIRIVANDLDAPATEIADLYKRRWAIELFFRWIKQMLKLRHCYGTSENAVKLQIITAMIAFVLLRLAHMAQSGVHALTTFATIVQASILQRRQIDRLGRNTAPNQQTPRQSNAQGTLCYA